MGETIEMINKHSKAMQLWYRMWDNTKCSLVYAKFNSSKSNVTKV
jgi:hypothetical protein